MVLMHYCVYGVALNDAQTMTLLASHFPELPEIDDQAGETTSVVKSMYSGGRYLNNGLWILGINQIQDFQFRSDGTAVIGVPLYEKPLLSFKFGNREPDPEQDEQFSKCFAECIVEIIAEEEKPIYLDIFTPGYKSKLFDIVVSINSPYD